MSKVRFGLIGCGIIGNRHCEIINNSSKAELAGVCDLNETAAKAFADKYGTKSYTNYAQMLKRDDIDVITICLPSGMHHSATVDAANAGKHVVVEKPIEISVAKAQDMIDICKKNKVTLSVIFQHRFDAAIEALKDAVDRGILGNLNFGASRTIWYRQQEYYTNNTWRGTLSLDGGGALINQSIHYIDLLLYIMGPVESVMGKCRTLMHKSIECEDIGVATLQFTSGAIGTIEGMTLAYPGLHTELGIFGDNGSVIIKNEKLDFYKFKDVEAPNFEELINNKNVLESATSNSNYLDITSHKKQYEDIISSIKANKEPMISGEEAIKSLKVIKAIYESSTLKKEVLID